MARRRTEPPKTRQKHGRRSLSPEQRKALSERAKRMHADGKLDARANGALGGRPKAEKNITAHLAAAAVKDKAAIVRALREGIREGSPAQRVKAVETWARLADLETQREQKAIETEAKVKTARSRDQMIASLAQGLAHGPVGDLLRQQLATDSTAAEIEEAEEITASSTY